LHWKELESDVKLDSLLLAVACLDCFSAVCVVTNLAKGVRIYALRTCVEAVMAHVRPDKKEVGGLLLGRVYQDESRARDSNGALTVLTDSIPSKDYRNSSVSLEMGTEVWNRLGDPAAAGKVVVGWYHSHPNLGAFFSGTDRGTQRAFFNHHYSIGWVIDPFRDEQKVFCGGESDEYQHSLLVLDNGLELAKSY
jgi:proteasome lid subunit RPN8/RPN11